LPEGADAVLMQEDAERSGDEIIVRAELATGRKRSIAWWRSDLRGTKNRGTRPALERSTIGIGGFPGIRVELPLIVAHG